ncbi:hypothetical protein [Novosphingobium sp. ST904]|uniref:hypothetical protein n=1 Tax=Novosphingobium sp. ST904 TaxID=1684385 RepID=UPI0012E0DE6F|nr:hypothetical protein [Novosphingobium sp. ST904]
MLDELLIGFFGGLIGERLFGKWARRHPRLTYLICIPPLLAIVVLAVRQMLRS